MTIYFFANETSLKNVPLDTKLITTEEDFELVVKERKVDKLSTTCSVAFNRLQPGDTLEVFDWTGCYTISFDGETYTTTPRRTEKELRREHNMEKLWRGGAFYPIKETKE